RLVVDAGDVALLGQLHELGVFDVRPRRGAPRGRLPGEEGDHRQGDDQQRHPPGTARAGPGRPRRPGRLGGPPLGFGAWTHLLSQWCPERAGFPVMLGRAGPPTRPPLGPIRPVVRRIRPNRPAFTRPKWPERVDSLGRWIARCRPISVRRWAGPASGGG